MNVLAWRMRRGKREHVLQIVSLLLVLSTVLRAEDTLGCPNIPGSFKCSCYTFEDVISFECQQIKARDVNVLLKSFTDVYSLSVIELDDDDEQLGPQMIPQGLCVKHIYISQSDIQEINDESFINSRKCLETLSIVSSNIKQIPQKALSGLLKLISLDLSSNSIETIASFSFFGLPLIKLNLKENKIRELSDSAFSSLELSLSEIDLSDNNLTKFPISSISELRHLHSLTLSWNSISTFPNVRTSDLSLLYLNLNYNNFEFVSEDCLGFSPSLKTLSFHFNYINNIHYRAFYSLIHLESLDLSDNRIKFLNPKIFQNNKNIEIVDLSHNHLHHIHGLFCNLPSLLEVVLSDNNILDVPNDSFFNSSKIDTIYLDKNSLLSIHRESFSNLEMLAKLHLQFNFIIKVPQDIFVNNHKLVLLRLDNNNYSNLENSTFKYLDNMSEIRLNHNTMKCISKHLFIDTISLEEIYLHDNKINVIEPGAFKTLSKLKYLNLEHNYIVSLSDILPSINSKVLQLYLDHNSITNVNSFMLQDQKHIYQLSLKNNNIKYISKSSFHNLFSVVRLELNNNDISVIEHYTFQYFNSTRFLDLKENEISNITNYTFLGLTELEDLNLSHNKIILVIDMAFNSLKKIRNLNLSFNPLKALRRNLFQHALPLSSLYLDSCDVQFIEEGTFKGLNNLKLLSLKNNSLKSLDILLIDVPGLKHLYFSYNVLDQLPKDSFLRLPLLETIYLEHCNIETIIEGTFSHTQNLLRLHLGQNIINNLRNKVFHTSTSILELNISNNFLDFIPYDVLHNFTKLELLDISDNLLSRVELSGFEYILNLKYLILKNNEIKLITADKRINLYEMTSLDLSYNKLANLTPAIFESFPNLQNINISYNEFLRFDFKLSYKGAGTTLINIDISRNPTFTWITTGKPDNSTLIANLYELRLCATNMTNIDAIRFDGFSNLQHLYLQLNNLRRLSISPFVKLNLLEDLDLSYNRISQLKTSNFRGLMKLRSLCMSHNNIESIESFTEDLSNLKLLDLSYNKLQNILNEDLLHLKELTVLYLNYNNIKYISATSFRNLNKLTSIDLTRNKLQKIALELLSSVESNILVISLKDNSLICNCDKENPWSWFQDHPKVINPSDVSCVNREHPTEKCDVPVISQLSVDKHKDNSISVSWFIRNRTAIKGIQILYYGEDVITELKVKYLERDEVSTRINDLEPNTNYVICVITINEEELLELDKVSEHFQSNNSLIENVNATTRKEWKNNQQMATAILMQSPSSECVSVNTFNKLASMKLKPSKPFDLASILNRRTGLVVGCSLGVVVFTCMVSVLSYTKLKERRKFAKSDPDWAEMNDYKVSKEDILNQSTTVSTDNILLGCK